MDKCYENNQAFIEYNAAQEALIITWKGFVQGEEYRNIMTAFYDLSEQKNIRKWCFDSRERGTVGRNDQQWVTKEVVRRAFHTNPIKTAIILSRNVFLQHSIDNIIDTVSERTDYTKDNDIYRVFNDREEALAWLYQERDKE